MLNSTNGLINNLPNVLLADLLNFEMISLFPVLSSALLLQIEDLLRHITSYLLILYITYVTSSCFSGCCRSV